MRKRLPYGISNYRTVVNDNFIYVDKTKYIEILENLHDTFVFFLRPRRFGKSLFTSVLENYYDVNAKEDFEKLFGHTYIGKNPTKEKNSYHIIKFNFSALNTATKDTLESEFTNKIKAGLDTFMATYNFQFDYLKDGSAAAIFDSFINKARQVIKLPVYVIIDEYDHFANELLSFQTHMFSDIISRTGFVRKFYEALKIGTESIVKRIFATGVSPITLDSLTSGFNIASDMTRDRRFNEMMGFNEEEVRGLIVNTSFGDMENEELDILIDELRKNYNGYLFSEDCKVRLFNSDMVLYYLKSYEDFGAGPNDIIDKNIASDYAKLGNMFNLKNKTSNMKVLDKILKGEQVRATITAQFSLEKDFDEDDFKSLLFYLGMLTIDKPRLNRAILKVPNYVIKTLYFDLFMKKINENMDYQLDAAEVKEAMEDIALDGDNTALIKIVERTLNKLSNRDYIKFDEKYVKLIFLTYCFLSKIYLVKSEYEVENGYIDVALLKQVNVEPDYFAIFELKYISKSDYQASGDILVEEKLNEAIIQLKKYKESQELSRIDNLKKWAIIFVGDKCVINKEI